tara:strand:+ start:17 stop:532 length:516 start_codon:yes stop_codon:yes gene_type:complete
MGKTTFSGPVASQGGFYSAGANSVIDVPNGTASFTIGTTSGYDVVDYAGKLITLSDAAMTITLPTISAAASSLNNLGLIFRFFVALDSTAMIINCGGSDVFVGGVYIGVDNAASGESQRSDGSDNTFTMNGSTKGGDAGSYVEFEAAAALTWSVRGDLLGSGSIITPFTTV